MNSYNHVQETKTKVVCIKIFWFSRQFSREQWMEIEEKVERRRGGKTISKSVQKWTLLAQLRQLKTGQDGKGLLRSHLWCPNDLTRLWDRLE